MTCFFSFLPELGVFVRIQKIDAGLIAIFLTPIMIVNYLGDALLPRDVHQLLAWFLSEIPKNPATTGVSKTQLFFFLSTQAPPPLSPSPASFSQFVVRQLGENRHHYNFDII